MLVQVKAVGIDYIDIRVAEGYGRAMRCHFNKYNPVGKIIQNRFSKSVVMQTFMS